jgi:hypothetical protein
VSNEHKRRLQSKILSFGDGVWEKRIVRLKNLPKRTKRTLWDLVDNSSICALRQLKVDTEFILKTDPDEWDDSENYALYRQSMLSLKVINDGAERGIALVSELNSKLLTRDEDEFQRIVQVVEENRKKFPGVSKSTFMNK